MRNLFKRFKSHKCPLCDKQLTKERGIIDTGIAKIEICEECADVFEAMHIVKTGKWDRG